MDRPNSLSGMIKSLSKGEYRVSFIEAYVISLAPLELQAVTDNALIISDSNLLPVGEQFSAVTKKATIYNGSADIDEDPQEVEIEIDNSIKDNDLFLLLEFSNSETCKYLIVDRL